jgi:hypothetical protein
VQLKNQLEKNYRFRLNNPMDKDSKLIFENYLTSKNNVVLVEASEEEKEHWLVSVGKVLDPTGISSWPDVIASGKKLNDDFNLLTLGELLLNVFLALPNFGLLAAGVGGVGWAGLKAAAKAAARGGAKDIGPVSAKILEMISKNNTVKRGFEKAFDSLVQKNVLDPKNKAQIMKAIESGSIRDALHGKSIEKGIESISKSGEKLGIGKSITGETPWYALKNPKLQKMQYGGRAAEELLTKDITSDPFTDKLLQTPLLPKEMRGEGDKQQKGPTKETAAKGKYPVGTWTPRKKTEPTSQKEQKPPQEKPKTKSKFDYENL